MPSSLPKDKLQLRISASRIGGHFQHGCERYTAYSLLESSEKTCARTGWEQRKKSKGHTASQDAGHIWEWDVLCMLEDEGYPCYAEWIPRDKKNKNSKKIQPKIVSDFHEMKSLCNVYDEDAERRYNDVSVDRTIEILRDPKKFLNGISDEKPGYIYQAQLACQDIFRDEVLLQNGKYRDFLREVFSDAHPDISAIWSICKPDLVMVRLGEDDEPVFSIIDIKHAKHPKMSHKVQVAIYAKLLSTLLRVEGIKGRVEQDTGYLWNFRRKEPVGFDLTAVMPFVDKYFMYSMPETMQKLVECVRKERENESNEDLYNGTFPALPSIQCEWCENYEHCMKWQRDHEPVTLLPYLSRYGLIYSRENGVPLDLPGFERYLSEEENLARLKDACLGWKRILRTGPQNLEALRSKIRIETERGETGEQTIFASPVNKDVSSLTMPAGETVRIILTAQRDEATDRMFAMGIYARTYKEDVLPHVTSTQTFDHEHDDDEPLHNTGSQSSPLYEQEQIFIAPSPEDLDATIRSFFRNLYDILMSCNNYNRAIEIREKVTLQAYVMDTYEQMNIEEMLLDELLNGEGVTDPEYRAELLPILYWLMGEHMITDVDEQADSLYVDFPLVVITSVVKALFSIPSFISYDMETICDALIGSDTESKEFKRFKKYNHILSNTMKSDAINLIWAKKEDDIEESLEGIRKHIRIRLHVESRMVRKIREKSGGVLKRWPEPFLLSGNNIDLSVRASKLITEQKYEELLTYHDIRALRMKDLEELVDEGQILKVRLVRQNNTSKWSSAPRRGFHEGFVCEAEIINHDVYFLRDLFCGVMIAVGDERAREELQKLSIRQEDGQLPLSCYPIEESGITRVYGIDTFSSFERNGKRMVSFERYKGFDEVEEGIHTDDANQEGTVFYILPSYKDLNGTKVISALCDEGRNLPENDQASILYPETIYSRNRLIRPTRTYNRNGGVERLSERDLSECLRSKPVDGGKDFTDSQKKAFRQMFFRNITLLLGPPGTGKTDFIARALITLCKYYASKGRKLAVLLSANSHSAINNMLAALVEKEEGAVGEPALYKLNKWGDTEEDKVPGVELVSTKRNADKPASLVFSFEENKPVVMGATCWQIEKAVSDYGGGFRGFDMVVIDEASQVRAMDAVIMLQQVISTSDSRMLIVGDEDQLSPVLLGKYDAKDQPVDIYGSVFRLFYDSAREYHLDYMVPLEEQFRMNEILSRYPAKSIYDRDIRPGDGRKGYHAFDFGSDRDLGIATQKLSLLTNESDPDMDEDGPNIQTVLQLLADPEYPLIVCRIHDGVAKEKRDEEIRLVTAVVRYLREHMCVPGTSELYESDDAFWGSSNGDGGLGIISPHHEQINRLKDEIASEMTHNDGDVDRDEDVMIGTDDSYSDKIFIGTVDKLQGRQREAVIVSYGVTDPEKAALEMEFIYSRNRLNVAMTRGKKKTICFLSDTLLDKSLETLNVDDEETLKGIDHMTGLLDFMQEEEADTSIDNHMDISLGSVKIDVLRKRMK